MVPKTCPKGHEYDGSLYSVCPHCVNAGDAEIPERKPSMFDAIAPPAFVRFDLERGGVGYILAANVQSVDEAHKPSEGFKPYTHIRMNDGTEVNVVPCDADAVMAKLGLPVAK